MKTKIALPIFLIIGIMVVFWVVRYSQDQFAVAEAVSTATVQQQILEEVQDAAPVEPPGIAEPPEIKEHVHSVKLAAIGDILVSGSVYRDAHKKDGYDFTSMFEEVKPFLSAADLAIANQETMLGGTELGLSEYPRFNSPKEMGTALQKAGIDVMTLANNHTLDRGEKAILNTLDHLDKLGVINVGANRSAEDQARVRTVEKNGITFSFLAYTYGTNGIPLPKDKPYLVNLIDKEKMKKDIEKAKELSDVIVVSLHFGNEYERMPNQTQKELAQFLADQGVQIVIGHHPHVLQPVSWLTGANGNQTFVAWSLGNFISGQDGKYKEVGGIVGIDVVKKVKGDLMTIELKEPTFLPTFCYKKNYRNYKIKPLAQVNPQTYEEIKAHMNQWVPELKFVAP